MEKEETGEDTVKGEIRNEVNVISPEGSRYKARQGDIITTQGSPLQDSLADPSSVIDKQLRGVIYDALKLLTDGGVRLIEYTARFQIKDERREVAPVFVDWAVPDNELPLAENNLRAGGFFMKVNDAGQCFGHRKMGSPGNIIYDYIGWCVHLLPLPHVLFSVEDTHLVPSVFSPEINILTPRPPRYMLAMIRGLQDFRRLGLEKDLLQFMGSYVFKNESLYISSEARPRLVDERSEDKKRESVEKAVAFIKTWDWGEITKQELVMAEKVVRNFEYLAEMMGNKYPRRYCVEESPLS